MNKLTTPLPTMASHDRRMRARATLLRGLFVTRWKGKVEEIVEEDRGEAIMLRFSVEKARRLHEREVGILQPRGIRRLASLCRVARNVAIGLREEWDRGGLRPLVAGQMVLSEGFFWVTSSSVYNF